jgi:hypothetical protein
MAQGQFMTGSMRGSRSTENVEENVATGTFGAWDETGRNIHLALAGALQGLGYGRALGKFITEDGATLPSREELARIVAEFATDPLAAACADLLSAMQRHGIAEGRHEVSHAWKHGSIIAQAWRLGVPVTVHPGIGYDIVACHPMFNGAVIGRAATEDFRLLGGAVERLDGGVVFSIGSAIMAPQVFEKSLSCVHNLRFQDGRPPLSGHSIYVVDLQDGGIGIGQRRTAQDEPGLLSSFLQELLADGRRDAISAVRQCYFCASPLRGATVAPMTPERFHAITSRYSDLRIAVLGDFCLDRYFEIDPAKAEKSIETGLTVYNVVNVRCQPGAAGTILNNLVALGIGHLPAIGFAGLMEKVMNYFGRSPRNPRYASSISSKPASAALSPTRNRS